MLFDSDGVEAIVYTDIGKDGMGLIEDSDALRVHLRALPDREYRIVIMRFFESLTQSEIAAQMGISQMHVSRLQRGALGKMRGHLSKRQERQV